MSSIQYNMNYKYYSRQAWLHKKHIDEDDGGEMDTLGRYSVFTGLMLAEQSKFSERNFITLEHCKDLCDADPPAQVDSNQRLGTFDPKKEYPTDGCSAFSYSQEAQKCLLNCAPIGYTPEYNYYGKKSAMVDSDSTQTPSELESDARLANGIEIQKISAVAAEKADAAGAEASTKNQELKAQTSVVDQQAKIAKEATASALSQLKAEELAFPDTVHGPRASRKEEKELTLKESTEKDFAKETMMDAQEAQNEENRQREVHAKRTTAADRETAVKRDVKNREALSNTNEALLKGNLQDAVVEFTNRAILMANNERDLKDAINRGEEYNSKETIVKSKVRSAMVEIREKQGASRVSRMQATASQAASNEAQDAQAVAREKQKAQGLKNALATENIKLAELKSRMTTADQAVQTSQAAITTLKQQTGAQASEQTNKETSKLANAQTQETEAKKAVKDQALIVAEKQAVLNALTPEIVEATQDQKLAAAKAEAARQNIQYQFYGERPSVPTQEEVDLYRKFSKEYCLPLEEDAIPPNPANPPNPADEMGPADTAE